MTAPVAQIIETGVGRAQRLSPAMTPDGTVDFWLFTFPGPWQSALFVQAIPPNTQVLQLHTHYLTACRINPEAGVITPRQAANDGVHGLPSDLYVHPLRLREGTGQGIRLLRDLALRIMGGELSPVPVTRDDRTRWRIAIGLGISAALSAAGQEYAEIAHIKRLEDR